MANVNISVREDCSGHWIAVLNGDVIAHAYGWDNKNIIEAARQYFSKKRTK